MRCAAAGAALILGFSSSGGCGDNRIEPADAAVAIADASSAADAPPAVSPPPSYLVVGGGPDGVSVSVMRHHEDGSLDLAYGAEGRSDVDLARWALDAAVDGSGRLVVAANHRGGRSIAIRFTCEGDLDTSFGGTGYVLTTVYGLSTGIAARDDGHIVLATQGNVERSESLFGIAPSGLADHEFGAGGVATLPSASLWPLTIAPDDRLVLGGEDLETHQAAAFRLTSSGAPDSSFGSGGRALIDLGSAADPPAIYGVAVTDQRLVLAGTRGDATAMLVALRGDGSLDTSFGGGVVAFGSGRYAEWMSVAITPDGRVVATGTIVVPPYDYTYAVVARYTAAGAPDPSFGAGTGLVTLPVYAGGGVELALEPDGRIVVLTRGGDWPYSLVRLQPGGELDPTFGLGGVWNGEGMYGPSALVRTEGPACVH